MKKKPLKLLKYLRSIMNTYSDIDKELWKQRGGRLINDVFPLEKRP